MDPLAKVGGLADVIGTLAKRLNEAECDLRVILPFYKQVKKSIKKLKLSPVKLKQDVVLCIDWLPFRANVYKLKVNKVNIYLIENDELYNRDQIYATREGEFEDNDIRFGFLSLAALETVKSLGYKPDVIHCHDWQTALVPICLRWRKHLKNDPFFKDTRTVFTIHNISFQGAFGKNILEKFGLPEYLFTSQGLELQGKANLLKGGIIYSDMVTTVSPTYAEELKRREYSYGMDAVLKWISRKSDNYTGILNGIDYDLWDPKTDSAIYEKYSNSRISGKRKNKEKLQKELGLEQSPDTPVIAFVSKLNEQKGVDLLIDSLPQIFDLGYQLVISGEGEQRYEQILRKLRRRNAGNISVNLGLNEELERKVYAGSDMILKPSRFEPCGLAQLISLRYGTVPVVRGTGGLIDTVRDYSKDNKNGNGFVFEEFSKVSLLDALLRAISVYENKREWHKLLRRGMKEDFSWRKSGMKYLQMYGKLAR